MVSSSKVRMKRQMGLAWFVRKLVTTESSSLVSGVLRMDTTGNSVLVSGKVWSRSGHDRVRSLSAGRLGEALQ